MRWTNKGHELDRYVQALVNKKRDIYVMGYGQIGIPLAESLHVLGVLSGIIDNDINKQSKVVYGKKIMSLDEYNTDINILDSIIVIAVGEQFKESVAKQLFDKGYVYGKDFFYFKEFLHRLLPIYALYMRDKVFVPNVQISLTERCTLKCGKCAHGCYAVKNDAEDMPLSMVYKSVDSLFMKVDYIHEFVLIGGEPLLYKNMREVIEYVGSRYRKQINRFLIITNGTITPTQDVLEMCKKYNTLVNISNYVEALPYIEKHQKRLIEVLEKQGVTFVLFKPDREWMDYGFDHVNRDCTEEELIKVFSSCDTPCREIRGNKYYYCIQARATSDNLKLNVGQDDYLDLDKLTGKNYKKVLVEFGLGYSEKGYLDMCRYCNGIEAKDYPIPVAEQVREDDR